MLLLNVSFTHTCGYTRVPAHLSHLKFQNLVCTHTHIVAHNIGMILIPVYIHNTWRYIPQAHVWFATLHKWCTATVTIAIGNEIHLFYSLIAKLFICCNQRYFAIYKICWCVLINKHMNTYHRNNSEVVQLLIH